MAAGKSSDGVDGASRAASCSDVSVISSEASLARSYSVVRAPMSVDVTAGRLPTQASATSAEPTPTSAAIRATASMTTQP